MTLIPKLMITSPIECSSFKNAHEYPDDWIRVPTTWPYPLYNREVFKNKTKLQAVQEYDDTFVDMLLSNKKSMAEFRRLQDMVERGKSVLLTCVCQSAVCHAQVIRRKVLDSSINEVIACRQKIKT